MITPETAADGLARLEALLLSLPPKAALEEKPPLPGKGERVLSLRQATLSPSERLPAAQCQGRILSSAHVSCPPAIPIVACGERIDSSAIACFHYYGIDFCWVVKE